MAVDKSQYRRLGSVQDTRSSCHSEALESDLRRSDNVVLTRMQARIALCCISLLSICVLLLGWALLSTKLSPSLLECAKRVSPHSPLWDGVEFWEGNFVNYFNHSSIYRGPPTHELERAWSELIYSPYIGVDADGLEALNGTSNGRKMELTDSDPANPVYAAVPEVFHQLHCLNLVRRYTWPVSMYNKSWGQLYPSDRENLVASRMHVDHCIEALRLSLMCYSDITPSFILYDANLKYGKGDFNVYHKCRDFHKISDYVREHGGEMRTNDVADKHP